MSGVVLLIAVAVVVGGGSLFVNYRLGSLLDEAINQKAHLRFVASQIQRESVEMMAAERGLAFAMMLQQTAQADAMRQKFQQAQDSLQGFAVAYREAGGDANGDLGSVLGSFESARQQHAELRSLMEQQKMDMAITLLNERLLPGLQRMSETSKRLTETQNQALDRLKASAATTASVSFWIIVGLNLVALGVGAMVFLMVKALTATLRKSVSELGQSAQQLSMTSLEVGNYSMSLSKSASDQAASLEETSASTEEIHSMTRSNADNSKQAASRMEEAARRAEEANLALAEMVHSMNEISTSSGKISKIIKVIDEIAFQTNILALNAAVEAARAGEAGMGFAVVADEVRNLAQRSAQAAKDTTQLIEESIHSASTGKQKLDQVAQASQTVNELVKSVASLVKEVRQGSEEQERGIDQIAKAVSQMERVTQQVAANAEEGAASGEELKRHATTVSSTVKSLQDLVGGEVPTNAEANSSRSVKRGGGKVAPAFSPATRNRTSAAPKPTSATAVQDPFPMDGDFEEF
jgi:methyl-accepting chemotaxis protein/methyl-accepting chemotaxis protein-1 (serine sensor receptor)